MTDDRSPRALVTHAVQLLQAALAVMGDAPPAAAPAPPPSEIPSPELEQARELQVPFGKHKGKPLKRVLEEDRGYLHWLTSDKFEPTAQTGARLKAAAHVVLKGPSGPPDQPPPEPDDRDGDLPF